MSQEYAKKERFEFTYKEAAEELKKQGFQTSYGCVYNEIMGVTDMKCHR